MPKRKPRFQATAGGEDIDLYHLPRPPIQVRYSGSFEEQEARIKAGLSIEEYDSLPGDPLWIVPDGPQTSKAHVVAFARLRNKIEAVFIEADRRKQAR